MRLALLAEITYFLSKGFEINHTDEKAFNHYTNINPSVMDAMVKIAVDGNMDEKIRTLIM